MLFHISIKNTFVSHKLLGSPIGNSRTSIKCLGHGSSNWKHFKSFLKTRHLCRFKNVNKVGLLFKVSSILRDIEQTKHTNHLSWLQ